MRRPAETFAGFKVTTQHGRSNQSKAWPRGHNLCHNHNRIPSDISLRSVTSSPLALMFSKRNGPIMPCALNGKNAVNFGKCIKNLLILLEVTNYISQRLGSQR